MEMSGKSMISIKCDNGPKLVSGHTKTGDHSGENLKSSFLSNQYFTRFDFLTSSIISDKQ